MSLPDRLSTLSSTGERGGSTEQRRDSDGSDYSGTAAERQLVQRCVIIQKDERGYGLTVSGDNPVYVASVKPEGAAAKAGVQKDDRIVKVNGTLVLNRNHIDVVKLIRSGSYVALTLMGKPNLNESSQSHPASPHPADVNNAPSNRNSRITAPQPVDPDTDRELNQRKVHMTRVMLEQAREDFLKQQKQYVKTPSEKLHTQLLDKERTVKTLENQLRMLTGGEEPLTQGTQRLSDLDQNSADSSANSWAASLPVTSDMSGKLQSPHASPSISPTPLHPHNARHDNDDRAEEVESGIGSESTSIASVQQEIITIDDEDVDSDEDQSLAMETGPFSDLRLLEKKPAHMAVFLHYLISNSDPSAMLFYIVTDMFKQTAGSTKDLRKWGYEIYSTFLVPTAPLLVGVSSSLVSRVGELLAVGSSRSENEMMLRSMFDACRTALGPELTDQLVEFRNMRAMGLGNIFGVHELLENSDKNRELKTIEKYLVPHLQHCSVVSEEVLGRRPSDKDVAMGWALATFLRQVGLSKPSSAILDRVQSFIMKDKRSFKLGSRSAKAKAVKGHQFNLQHFYTPTLCSKCEGLIWGVGYQGFLCQSCEIGVHKQCVEDIVEVCSGKKRKRTGAPLRPRSSVPSIGGDTGGPAAVPGEAKSPPHTSADPGGPFTIQPVLKEDDMELAHLGTEVSVKSRVKSYQELGSPDDSGNREETGGGDDRKGSVDLNRSESLKGKGDKSERPTRRAKSDVDRDDMIHAIGIQSGSSSASSLSNPSGESPSHSSEHVNESIAARTSHYDSDLEVEELPPLKQVLGDEVSRLKPKEKKRQEVINELFHTERAHLRNLKVLDLLFNQPMLAESGVMPELARALFPNMDEIITLHASMNRAMKERRSRSLVVGDVGDILLDRFDNEPGDRFRKACAEYCRNQSFALEHLKHYRRKDQRLAQFLTETEADKLCRKLELKDHVPCQMQRLTKYPMLIENLLKYSKSTSSQEYKNLERALERSKHILAYVNHAVRECQNYHKLKEMQKKLETRAIDASADPNLLEIKHLDLTAHKLVFEGPLVWRLRSHRLIDLQVVLMEDILVLLQRADDRLVLKCQSTNLQPIGSDFKYTHSPVLKLQNLLARDVATDKKAFFVINTSDTGPQIYELVAQTQDARKTWCRLVNEKAEERKKLVNSARKMPRVPESSTEPDEMFRVRERIMGNSQASSPSQAEEAPAVAPAAPSSEHHDRVDNLRSVATAELQPPLVQPDQVSVSGAVTAEAQAVLTPIERLRRNDQVLEQALLEKEAIVAELLQVNRSDYQRLAQQGVSISSSQQRESADEQNLIVACIDNTNRLIQLLSAQASSFALSTQQQGSDPGPGAGATSQTASVASENGSAGSSQLKQSQAQLAQGAVSQSVTVPMPVNTLQCMAVEMNQILATLMRVMEVKEEERHTLRSQLEAAQKQLDMLKTVQQQILAHQPPSTPQSRPLSFVSIASSISEAGEVTDSEVTEDDSASVLNIAQTQELTQEMVEETTETAAVLLPQLTSPPAASAPHNDDDSDEERYSMIPENLPLPEDNCVEGSAPFADVTMTGADDHGEREGSRDRTLDPKEGSAVDAVPDRQEPMVTDLDEGGEDVLTTPTPSPVSPELTEGGGEQGDVDSVRTVEEEDSDEGTPHDENFAPVQDSNPDHACIIDDTTADITAHMGQGLLPSGDPTEPDDGRPKTGEDVEHGDNNNRTCQDSELTNPIEI